MKKSRPWKEAPVFHLIGLLVSILGLLIGATYYAGRFERDGWMNEHFLETVLYGFLFVYFMIGVRSGKGESEAIEEVLEDKEKR